MSKLQYNARVYEGTTSELATDTKVYANNDLIFDTEAGVLKKGNGVDQYADLPVFGGGGGESTPVTWATLSGKPAVIAGGADQAAARAAIGAGTGNSNLAIGTTATTALAGNTALLVIGTTATTAKVGNYTPSTAEVGNALKAKTQVAALVSPTADYADLTAVTAALKSIIDALKA